MPASPPKPKGDIGSPAKNRAHCAPVTNPLLNPLLNPLATRLGVVTMPAPPPDPARVAADPASETPSTKWDGFAAATVISITRSGIFAAASARNSCAFTRKVLLVLASVTSAIHTSATAASTRPDASTISAMRRVRADETRAASALRMSGMTSLATDFGILYHETSREREICNCSPASVRAPATLSHAPFGRIA